MEEKTKKTITEENSKSADSAQELSEETLDKITGAEEFYYGCYHGEYCDLCHKRATPAHKYTDNGKEMILCDECHINIMMKELLG